MPELRRDPVTGRAAFIAEDRANRPNDFEAAGPGDCPFCAGHESQTPHESAAACDAQGQWLVRVVPNKYPIATASPSREGSFGAHEVIIESPSHVRELTDLSLDQFARVLRMYRDRIRRWAATGEMRHALVFKNSGPAAGASLEHIHSQLVAVPFVPQGVQAELEGAAAHYAATGRCIYCDLVTAAERVVLDERGFVAFTAFAGRQPYETWLLPRQHRAQFDALTDGESHDLAAVLMAIVRRLQAVVPGVAYNLLLHTGPFDGDHADSYHWHWELIPRLTQLAGFEWGAGGHINPVSPERAAAQLRDARV